MEKVCSELNPCYDLRMKRRVVFYLPSVIAVVGLVLTGCTTKKIFEYDKADQLKKVDEYDNKLKIKELPENGQASPVVATEPIKDEKKGKKKKKEKVVAKKTGPKIDPKIHQPSIEDAEGFVGRRPVVDPFRVGEKVTLNMTYFNIVAGTLDISVKPFVEVNGEKSYQFEAEAKSNSFFNRIYAVDDKAVTYLSYNELLPRNLSITLQESKQLAEARTYFDWETMKANYWQKRVTPDHGEQNKKLDWEIKSFTQNIVSAVYYLRTFTMRVGKKLAIRVADEGKNIVFTGEIVRKEELETEIGTFRTVVIKPKVEVDGVLSPVGDIWIWLTDDDRKFMVRAEAKIKIGSLIAKVKAIDPGGDGKMPVQIKEDKEK